MLDDDAEAEKQKQQLAILVARIEKSAEEQAAKKTTIEDRWLLDLRQYHGRYDETTEAKLKEEKRSRVFANLTRPKAHSWEARLADMLFPTDDKNWGIKPTPVPAMVAASKGEGEEAAKAKAVMQEATARAEAMEREIDDQLTQSKYTIQVRRSIHDAVKLGTGIVKGPIANQKVRQGWSWDATKNAHVLAVTVDPKPTYNRVDPWNFFPDMSACTMEEAEFTYERHALNRKDMRKLARKPDFDKDAIRRVLDAGPQGKSPEHVAQIRTITDSGSEALEDRFTVWEYHGPLEIEEIKSICSCTGDQQMLEAMEEIDVLTEIMVVAWVCQGEILKFGPHPMESGESLYSVYNFEKDDTSIFGRGVPCVMRDPQAAINGAWRMTLDNSGAAAGPQVMVDKTAVAPENGRWEITPFKIWAKIKTLAAGDVPFDVFNIPSVQTALAGIIQIARQLCDEETNMPLIAEGQQAAHVTQTAQGMAMLMNAVNVVFRAAVKNFDDDITTPTIRRAYDWNMQHNPDPGIKGDFDIDARGSSVLLVREIQAQNLMAMAMQFAPHPIFGPLTKIIPLYRKLYQAHMLSADEFVKSEEEIQSDAEAQAQQPPPPDVDMMKLELQNAMANMDRSTKIELAMIEREVKLMVLAEQRNMSVDELRAKLDLKNIEAASRERMQAADIAMTARQNALRAQAGAVPAQNTGIEQ